jgi:integrase
MRLRRRRADLRAVASSDTESRPLSSLRSAYRGLHFHDLRHTGNTFAAMTGASIRDLMTRMGHDSMRAALIYQHKTQGADRKIAGAMEELIRGSTDDHS